MVTFHSPCQVYNRNLSKFIRSNLFRKTKCHNQESMDRQFHCSDLYRNEFLNWIHQNRQCRHRNDFHSECRNHILFQYHNCNQHRSVKRYNLRQRGLHNHHRNYFLNSQTITSKVNSSVKPEHRSGIQQTRSVRDGPLVNDVNPRIPLQDLIFSGPGPLQKQSQQPTKPVEEDKHIFMLETFGNFYI